MVKYVRSREACKILQVSEKTLRNWDAEGKIATTRLPNGHRRYDIDSVLKGSAGSRKTILYARVSSHKQREDLHRQADYLKSLFPDGEVVTEIGSGLNFKRKGLLSVLGRVMSGDVKEVVVTYSDRLVRFGTDLIRWLCEQNNCQLVVLNKVDLSPERELVEDILAIVHVFSCRLYGLRKYKRQIQEDPSLSG
jgi:predicted site-specific integrase-resolvase